jgi:signal transduction histidine kinase
MLQPDFARMRMHSDMSAAYRAEAEQLTAERFPSAVALFTLGALGFGTFEYILHPASLPPFVGLLSLQLVVALPPVLVRRALARRRRMVKTSIVVGVVLSVLPHLQTVLISLPTELMGIATVCTLTGMALVMPWGVGGQAIIAATNLLAYGTTLALNGAESTAPLFLFFAVSTGAALSVLGAYYLELHRVAIFREATLSEDEAAVNRTLVAAAREINAVLGQADALDRVCASTRAALRCDWSWVLLTSEGSTFRYGGGVSRNADALRELSAIEFDTFSFPLLTRILAEEHVEIPSLAAADPMTAHFMERWGTQHMLATRLTRSGQVVGILAAGGRETVEAIPLRRRLLFRGIAQHAAIAVSNVRLVSDLRAADQLKSEFLSTMSHELRTPLNVIIGYSELLAEDAFGPLSGDQRDTVGRVLNSARSLLELINATLDVNRIEAGRTPVQLSEVGLHDLVEDICRDAQQLPCKPDVQLRWDIGVNGERIRTDPGKLKIVAKNLIGNALKFTEKGYVCGRIAYDADIGHVMFSVVDTGRGIHRDDLGHIFDMFRQAGNGDQQGGVGLGLYIVKRFVEQLGGHVSVVSRPGHGSTFTVTVPVSRVERQAVEQHAA